MERIEEVGWDSIVLYESISIGFEIRSRLLLPAFAEVPIEPRWKDYDEDPEERPSSHPTRFDTTNWGVFLASRDQPVGGCIVAWNSANFGMLQGRSDWAVVVDLRVRHKERGTGVGRKLLNAALQWASRKGVSEVHVETQDTNVAACRFYRSMGFSILSVDAFAYGNDEARVMWTFDLKG